MRTFLYLPALAAAVLAGPAAAQSPEADVLEVVERLFDGMRSGDTTAMRSTFHPEIRLTTTGERNGQPVATVVPVSAWLDGVAGSADVLDERLYDPVVRVADNLATVWVYYTLHVGERFSHCGYDAFQLVRTDAGWRILQVTDTRQQEGCAHRERPQATNFALPPGEIEARLDSGRFQVVGMQDNRWEGDRTQRTMLRFPDGLTMGVKWARAAEGGATLNNEPRYELAAYRIQKLFLDEEDWVVPPTVLRIMPLRTYQQIDPELGPTFDGTQSVVVAVQYWLENVEALEQPDPERLDDMRYARRLGNLNLLTYLIRHVDSNYGNVLVSVDPLDPRMFAVDNGVAFRSPESPRGTFWKDLHVDRLPADAVARVRALTRAALDETLGVVAQFRVRDDGRLEPVEPTARLNPDRGVHREGGIIQFGLTRTELDELWARRQDLLDRVDRGEITTF